MMKTRLTGFRRDESRIGLRTLFLILPPALALLGAVHLFTLQNMPWLHALVVWFVALVLLLVRFGPMDPQTEAKWVFPVATMCAVLLVAAVGFLLLIEGQAVHTLYLVVILLGMGFFVISVPAFMVTSLAVAGAFFAALLVHGGQEDWLHAGIGLVLAFVLAAVFLGARYRTLHWLFDLRRRDEMQKTSLGRSFQAAHEAQSQSRALAEAAFEGIIVHKEGRVVDLNEAACGILGTTRVQAVGEELTRFLAQEEIHRYPQARKEQIDKEGETVESRWRLHDGREVIVEARNRVIPYKGATAEVTAVRDMTQARRDEREREDLRRRLQSILESAGEGVFGLDRDGRIVFANRAAADLCGRPVDQMVGQQAHAMFHHTTKTGEPYPASKCPILGTMLTGRMVQVEDEVFFRTDGSSFPVSYVASPLVEGTDVQGAVVVFQDVTERALLEKMKDELISVVGHELKTPLASVHGSLRLIEGTATDLPPHVDRLVRIATRNTARLSRLVNDLLDMERIRAGRIELDLQRHHAKDLLEEALGSMESFAADHGVKVVREPGDAVLRVDRDRILQALINLASNAVKFSPKGGTVNVGVDRDGSMARLWVKDHGPGIARQKQGLLFERFSQLDSSDAREKGGSGLGLVITRSLVEAHGGTVSLDSEPGKGSTFFIMLPMEKDTRGSQRNGMAARTGRT